MNKQLREFEKESGLDIYGLGARRDKWEAALEKYAELIVRECISITDELVVNSTRTSNELYADHNGALFEVKRRIESHFGVEE